MNYNNIEGAMNLENTKQENVIIVDRDDNEIGKSSRYEMRKNNLIHRCTSIIVTDKQGKFLVQKRSKFKEYCPSFLDLNIGGVVSVGEEDIFKSAIREINEEIGLLANADYTYEDLKFLGKSFFENNLTRNWSYNFHLDLKNSNFKLNFYDGEVEEVYWYSEVEIIGLIKKDIKITEDSIDIFINFINSRKNLI